MEAFFWKIYDWLGKKPLKRRNNELKRLRLANIKAYMVVHDELKICGQTFYATIRNGAFSDRN